MKNEITMYDHGTVETQQKCQLGLTASPLDYCKEKAIVTNKQYHAGRTLKWLYTKRYRSPHIRAAHVHLHPQGHYRPQSEAWLIYLEHLYRHSLEILKKNQCARTVLNICVFEERPDFFQRPQQLSRDYELLTKGLDILSEIWKRRGI